MPLFPYFGVRTSDGSSYLKTGSEINRKSHTNEFIFKNIYIYIFEKDKRYKSANKERG